MSTTSVVVHAILTASLSAAAAAAFFVAWRRTGLRGFLFLSAVCIAYLAANQLFQAAGMFVVYHFGTEPMVRAAVALQVAKSALYVCGIGGGLWVVWNHFRQRSDDKAGGLTMRCR